jgi:hypothetical protein
MRTLAPPPSSLLRVGSGAPDVALGSFAGPLPSVSWQEAARAAGRGALWRAVHDKRWIYVAVRDGGLVVAAAVVRTGYAATALAWVWRADAPGFVDERVAMGPPTAGDVVDDGPGARMARFEARGVRFVVGDGEVAIDAREGAGRVAGAIAADRPLHVRLSLEAASALPIAAVVAVPGGLVSATQKHLASVTGEILAGGERRAVRDGLGAVDYTSGLLARRTLWRWALALGRDCAGRRVALNVVEGFVGEAECALWVDDVLIPVGEARFELDPSDPTRPWTIRTTCGAVDLRFVAGAVHLQSRDLLLVRSRFLQPAGRFTGTIRVAGEVLADLDLLGVAEDQDVTW